MIFAKANVTEQNSPDVFSLNFEFLPIYAKWLLRFYNSSSKLTSYSFWLNMITNNINIAQFFAHFKQKFNPLSSSFTYVKISVITERAWIWWQWSLRKVHEFTVLSAVNHLAITGSKFVEASTLCILIKRAPV